MNASQQTPVAQDNQPASFWSSWWIYILPTYITLRIVARYVWPEVSYWKALGIVVLAVCAISIVQLIGSWLYRKLRTAASPNPIAFSFSSNATDEGRRGRADT